MQILKFFPNKIAMILKENLQSFDKNVEEIRLRAGQPIIIKLSNKDIVLEYKITSSDLLEILEKLCESSLYSYQTQICNGYITVVGGHRVGITGSVVMQENKIINIKYISSLNFRIAKQVIGCSNEILKYIINYDNNSIYSTLIVSPPGIGKTTILRDIIRQLSNGIGNFTGKTIGLVDERSEISAIYKGVPQNDVGIRTDILENIPKNIGMRMLIRSMAPQIICADEIGSMEDIDSIKYIVCSGVKGIFTVHGSNMEELNSNLCIKELLNLNIFERVIFLDEKIKGNLKEIYELKDKRYCKCAWNNTNVVPLCS